MPMQAGVYRLGPDNARLAVKTGRTGAVAKAGHDLLIHVTVWDGQLEVGEEPGRSAVTLTADSGSLRVQEGTGGMQALDDGDKANIDQTIVDEILRGIAIEFRSTEVETVDGGRLRVQGDLTLGDRRNPIAFELAVEDDGRFSGSAAVKQTDWGMKPYSALFGALKVADEVVVVVSGHLPAP